jgi:hypothetical protein
MPELRRSIAPLTTVLLATIPLGTLLLLGCPTEEEPPLITGIPNEPGGNPLVPAQAMYPFPSDFYLEDDNSTATGRRVAVPQEAMPEDLSASIFADADGFSRAPTILAWFDGGIDGASLPDLTDPSASLADDSAVWLLREDTWERTPILVELDLNAPSVPKQVLIIRPQISLAADTGYVVVLRDLLRAADGSGPPPVSDAFRALRDGIATDSDEVEAQRDDFQLVNAAIAGAGLPPEEVVLAWSFHTRSDEQITAPLVGMQDVAATWPLDGWALTSDEWDGDDRLIHGTFIAPDFLGDAGVIELDAGGAPIQHGTREVEFMLTIPDSSMGLTRPVIVYGHGFFSSMEECTWSKENAGIHQWQVACATTNFIGTNEDDLINAFGILGDLNRVYEWPSQQMQSHVHFSLLGRLVAEELADEVQWASGEKIFDADNVHYMGISNGGTQGYVILSASTVFRRGVLVVPGSFSTHMLERATQWNTMGTVFTEKYDDPRDLQLVLSLIQLEFDYIDSLSWVDHLLKDRLPGRPPLEVTLHMAVGDTQVSNMITEWIARTAGVPLIVPSAREVWGLDTVTAEPPDGSSSSSGLFVYDEGYPALDPGNVPPPEENDAHGTIRELEVYREHVGRFLEDGSIVQVCDGACDPD